MAERIFRQQEKKLYDERWNVRLTDLSVSIIIW